MSENTNHFRSSIKVYLDHNATTPVAEEIISGLPMVARIWGNPSSIHWAGRGPKSILRGARTKLAQVVGAHALEIIFTSGGTESNNTIIKGLFDLTQKADAANLLFARTEFITSKVEHPSVLRAFNWVEERGGKVYYLNVDRQGQIDMETYEKIISEKTALVSVMLANNETGTIFPIQKMAKIAHAKGAFFHSDCVQALGKISLNLEKLEIDYASFSAHKVYSLKGTGFLYVKKGAPMEPLLSGGGQERHRRGGTENTLGIWSLGEMTSKISKVSENYESIQSLRNYLEEKVIKEIPQVTVTSKETPRLPNTSSMVLKNVDGETLLMSLDLKGFAVSTGAACSSGNPEPSPVLLAIGLTREEAQSSLRVSLGWSTTQEQVDSFIENLKLIVERLRALPDFSKEAHV